MQQVRLPVIGVMGSGAQSHEERAGPLGRWLATLDVHLLTGGGAGVMRAVSRAFAGVSGRRGLVIGVLPGDIRFGDSRFGVYAPHAGYPNSFVELVIRTHLPHSGRRGEDSLSRNHINVLSSDLLVFLPGSAGTASEAALALAYGTPAVAYLDDPAAIPGLPADIPVVSDFGRLQAFVLRQIGSLRGDDDAAWCA